MVGGRSECECGECENPLKYFSLGTKIPKENFLKIRSETKKYQFCVLSAQSVKIAILHPKFEKVIKPLKMYPKLFIIIRNN